VAEKGGGGGSLQSGWNEDGSQSTAVGRSVDGGSMLLAGGKMFVMAQWIENQLLLRKQPTSPSSSSFICSSASSFSSSFVFRFFLPSENQKRERKKKEVPRLLFPSGGSNDSKRLNAKELCNDDDETNDVAWNEMEARV